MKNDVGKELGNNPLKTKIMAKLTTRESHLRRVGKKRKAMIKGKGYHFSNKNSSLKFRRILENNRLIINQLSRES
jgi:hypothetical protein